MSTVLKSWGLFQRNKIKIEVTQLKNHKKKHFWEIPGKQKA